MHMDEFFKKKGSKIQNKHYLTQINLTDELNEISSDIRILSKLSRKHRFELRRMMNKVKAKGKKLTARECLLLNRLRISREDSLNPERRKNTAIQHRQSKFHNKKSSINFKKYLTKPRADKFYKSVDDNYKLEAVIRSIISGTPVVSICPHFLIGSSLIYKLLSSKLQIADTHKYMMTSDARRFGKIAEDCAADMFNGTYQKPHERVIPRLPFIVASPDYFSEKENKIIEIKSHGDKHKGVKLSILQTVIAMEAFEVSIGEIWFFITNKNEQNTRLVNIVKLNKTAELFNENVCKEAIQAYIYYLKILLETMNYSSSYEEIARTN